MRAHSTAHRVAVPAAMILRGAEGVANSRIAGELGVSRPTVLEWRKHYVAEAPEVLTRNKPSRGWKPRHGARKVGEIVDVTLHTKTLTPHRRRYCDATQID